MANIRDLPWEIGLKVSHAIDIPWCVEYLWSYLLTNQPTEQSRCDPHVTDKTGSMHWLLNNEISGHHTINDSFYNSPSPSDSRFTHQMLTLQFLFWWHVNMWSINNPGHIQINWFVDKIHLMHQKWPKWPI